MSKVFYTSDWHIGHKNIIKYRPAFSSIEEHDNTIFERYKSLVGKRDVCYFLGDICFTDVAIDKIAELPGHKILVMGNHDLERGGYNKCDLFKAFQDVRSLTSRKGAWASHCPIHPDELRDKFNVHGHTHNHNIQDWRYANVSLENCNYCPVDFQDIKESFDRHEIFTKLI